ncbi:hypothetical protein ACL02P_10240 [Paenibacillus sp. MB22_1]|uniref:hypothetical protein n=1 Tax=Paenibacillus TaxID=44249 RepID=UPI0039A21643
MDINNEEKQIFNLINSIDKYGVDDIESINFFADELPDVKTLSRITDNTFRRLGLKYGSSLKRSRRSMIAKASILVLLLGTVLMTILSPEVIADLRKRLNFIPGLGIVQMTEQQDQHIYVLEQPFENMLADVKQTIYGVVVTNKEVQISLVGTGGNPPKTVSLITESGREYQLQLAISNQTEHSWQSSYYYLGEVEVRDNPSFKLRYDNNVIGPLILTEAESAENIEQLGPSNYKNGVLITSVVKLLEKHRVRVNLLSDLPYSNRVDFGIHSSRGLRLTDSKGNEIVIQNDSTSKYNPNELLFDANEEGPFTLTIPKIIVADMSNLLYKVTLPVPTQGQITTKVSVTAADFSIDFLSVERKDDSTVIIKTDLHDEKDHAKKLRDFRVVDHTGNAVTYKTQLDESTLEVKNLIFSIDPKQEYLTFNITEPTYVINGPWTLQFFLPYMK